MAEIKNIDTLAEVEFCLGRYLDDNIVKIMDDVRTDLSSKQAKEYADYQTTLGGILSSILYYSYPV